MKGIAESGRGKKRNFQETLQENDITATAVWPERAQQFTPQNTEIITTVKEQYLMGHKVIFLFTKDDKKICNQFFFTEKSFEKYCHMKLQHF